MKLTELARRLESAADDLAGMRAALSAEAPLAPPGAGPAQELITMLNAAWSARQHHLSSLTTEVTDLADNLRRSAGSYAASDHYAADALTSPDHHPTGDRPTATSHPAASDHSATSHPAASHHPAMSHHPTTSHHPATSAHTAAFHPAASHPAGPHAPGTFASAEISIGQAQSAALLSFGWGSADAGQRPGEYGGSPWTR